MTAAALAVAALILLQPAAGALPPELRCFAEVEGNMVRVAGLQVLSGTAEPGPFRPALPEGTTSLMCLRADIVPGPDDDEVLALGLPLYIAEADARERAGVIELDEGQFRFRMVDGRLDPAEQAAVRARLDAFQLRRRAAGD